MTNNFLADFQAVMRHFNLSAEERLMCMQSYRRNHTKAAAIYRAIAKSLV